MKFKERGMVLNNKQIKDREETDLKDLLVEFWIGVVEDPEADAAIKLKASEFLAKYILDAGKRTVKRRGGPIKPSTADILRLAHQLEAKDAD